MPPYSWVRSKEPCGSSSIEALVGQRADSGFQPGDRPRTQRLGMRATDLGVQIRVEHRVKRQRVQRRIVERPVVVLRQHRRRGQRAFRRDECPVVDFQHLPDVLEAGQREGVPLRHVVHRMLIPQNAVVRQRICHHLRDRRGRS